MYFEITQKLALYTLSMTLFFIIIGVLCMDIPIYFGKYTEFIGWSELFVRVRMGMCIILGTFIVEVLAYCYLKKVWKDTSRELSVKIKNIEEVNYDTLTFIASFMVPLVSFQFDKLQHWLVLVLLVVAIGYIFCHSKGYYMNPTLILLKFHLYKVVYVSQGKKEVEKTIILISKQKLSGTETLRFAKITSEVGYVM